MNTMLKKMQEARIPPAVFNITLAQLGQPVLRSVIVDGALVSNTGLKSISIVSSPGAVDPADFSQVVYRFAVELVAAGQKVLVMRCAGILRELDARDFGAESAEHFPLLSRLGEGFVVVPDFATEHLGTDLEKSKVCNVLLDHISRGGAVVLARPAPPEDAHPLAPTPDLEMAMRADQEVTLTASPPASVAASSAHRRRRHV